MRYGKIKREQVRVETKVYRFIDNEWKWVDIDFKDLKKGNIFRLIKPDGSYHMNAFGGMDWQASSNPFINEDGVYDIDTY